MTDSERIEEWMKNPQNGIVTIPQRKCETEPERDYWLIDRAILVPENTTVVLLNCKIKLSDRCRDNFFRSANCGLGIEEIPMIHNIHIRGIGTCVLEGADHPRATGDSSKVLRCPSPKTPEDIVRLADWIPKERREIGKLDFWDFHNHSYGTDAGKEGEAQTGDWRGIGILFANVQGFSIENLQIKNPHGWGISMENCCDGRVQGIDFESYMEKNIDGFRQNTENQDGVDVRNGCHHITISDITGGTGDDMVALTAIANRNVAFRANGALGSTHIMHNDWSRRDPDIHDIIIRNICGYSKGKVCNHVRLLAAGTKIYHVLIDGVVDTAPELYDGALVRIGDPDDAYGINEYEGVSDIVITNLIGYHKEFINIWGYLSNSVISNAVNRNSDCPAIHVWREDGLRNVEICGLVSSGEQFKYEKQVE